MTGFTIFIVSSGYWGYHHHISQLDSNQSNNDTDVYLQSRYKKIIMFTSFIGYSLSADYFHAHTSDKILLFVIVSFIIINIGLLSIQIAIISKVAKWVLNLEHKYHETPPPTIETNQ